MCNFLEPGLPDPAALTKLIEAALKASQIEAVDRFPHPQVQTAAHSRIDHRGATCSRYDEPVWDRRMLEETWPDDRGNRGDGQLKSGRRLAAEDLVGIGKAPWVSPSIVAGGRVLGSECYRSL